MTPDREALEEALRAWVRGWALCLGCAVTERDGWPLVLLHTERRHSELICADPGIEDWLRLQEYAAGRPDRMVTVVAGHPTPYAEALADHVRLFARERLMHSPIPQPDVEVPVSDADLVWELERGGRAATTRVVRALDDETVAAEGTVAVTGESAVFDRIETTTRYQRRGLGARVMHRLGDEAAAAGATRGLLVATDQGHRLYSRLGWSVLARTVSVIGG